MTFQALLFCPDEKTARVTTQVLTELEFSVEPCNEPFAAVKKLMGQHFDAIVVDCENEQNATLLFKSARNSTSNQGSLSVAVVEGQAGVANAFRIGANLVLTKPINVEQAKSTLRVARGLLRKGTETSKPAAPGAPTAPNAGSVTTTPALPAKPAVAATARPAAPAATPRPSAPTVPTATPAFAMSNPEPAAKTDATPLARADAEPAPAPAPSFTLPVSKSSNLPPRPATGPTLSATASGKTAIQPPASASGKVPVVQAPKAAAPNVQPLSSAAAAPARAKETQKNLAPVFEEQSASRPEFQKVDTDTTRESLFEAPVKETSLPAAPSFAALQGGEESESSGGSKKTIVFVLLILAVVIGGYFAYTKFSGSKSGTATPASTPTQTTPATPDAAPLSTAPVNTAPSAVVTPQPTSSSTRSETTESPVHTGSAAKQSEVQPEPEVVVTHPSEQKPMVVKSGSATRAAARPPDQTTAEVTAPPVLGTGETSETAISGIVQTTPSALPKVATETLRISQGVTDGLLIKKVPPIYPRQAMQMHLQGGVQLQAVIDKQGRITSVQVVKGDSILARAAVDAVKQWRYKPYFLDGQPVDIQTQITVNFKLP